MSEYRDGYLPFTKGHGKAWPIVESDMERTPDSYYWDLLARCPECGCGVIVRTARVEITRDEMDDALRERWNASVGAGE